MRISQIAGVQSLREWRGGGSQSSGNCITASLEYVRAAMPPSGRYQGVTKQLIGRNTPLTPSCNEHIALALRSFYLRVWSIPPPPPPLSRAACARPPRAHQLLFIYALAISTNVLIHLPPRPPAYYLIERAYYVAAGVSFRVIFSRLHAAYKITAIGAAIFPSCARRFAARICGSGKIGECGRVAWYGHLFIRELVLAKGLSENRNSSA